VKVILDANVIVSAAIQRGPSYRLVQRWLDVGDLEVVICPALFAEVEDVFSRPRLQRRIDPVLAGLYLATIRRIAVFVDDPAAVESVTRDVKDDYLVALGRSHSVDAIVTGDKDLLEWDGQRPPAVTPADFEQQLDVAEGRSGRFG
jgi:putative PIN family toxin of toxin-antitoxin system